MVHDLRQVLWVHRVQNIEEVGSRWSFVLGVLVGEELEELLVLLELGPERLDGELVIVRDRDLLHLHLLHQRFSPG